MYFAQDIWAFIALITIELVIIVVVFTIMDKLMPIIARFIWSKVIFVIFVSPEEIRIHEAGHLVAYLRTCKKLSKRNYYHKVKRVREMCQSRIGGSVYISINEWNYRNRLLIIGGVAAVLKIKNQHMTLSQYRLYKYLKGCYSDFYKLLEFYHMSKYQIIDEVNAMIDSLSERDMQFITTIADELHKKEEKEQKNTRYKKRTLSQDELFQISKNFYNKS